MTIGIGFLFSAGNELGKRCFKVESFCQVLAKVGEKIKLSGVLTKAGDKLAPAFKVLS